jgi:hypothetical protein
LKLLGTAEVLLDIENFKIPHTLFICQNLCESLILGREFLNDASAIIDFRNNTIILNDFLEIPLQHKIDNANLVGATEPLWVKPNTEIIFHVSCAHKFNNQDVLLSPIPSEQFRKFAVSNMICHVENNQTVCRLLNYSDKSLIINANQKIAQIGPFDSSYHCLAVQNMIIQT